MIRKLFLFSFIEMSLIAIISFFAISCKKIETTGPVTGYVELYLLESYKTVGNTNKIDESTVVTKATPIIEYSEFLSYDSSKYVFKISDKAKTAINNIKHSVFGVPFAVKANNEIVYTGYFWPCYSSCSCDWVVTDPIMVGMKGEMAVKLGYPGPSFGAAIPDKRNDKRILDIFANDHKLAK